MGKECQNEIDDTTLRDLFAAFALAGYMASDESAGDITPKEMSVACYRLADAMLEVRKEKAK